MPLVQAVQFDGKNAAEVKTLIGDTSEGEEFLVGTGEYEEEPEAEPAPEEGEEGPQPPKDEQPAEGEVNPDGIGAVPYDPKRKPAAGPKEKTETLTVSEGDWVVKDAATGEVEVNPEGFPDKYEFVSS